MRALGVKAEIKVNAVGERAAAARGVPDGLDDPADRVATFQVQVASAPPTPSVPGSGAAPVWRGEAVLAEQGGPAAAEKPGETVKISLEMKQGIAEPIEGSKTSIKGEIPISATEFDDTVKVGGKVGDLSGEAKIGMWGKTEGMLQLGADGIGLSGKAEGSAGEEARAQFKHGAFGADLTAFIGAKGEAKGQFSASLKGISAKASVDALAGISVGGSAKLAGKNVGVEGSAEAMAGLGVAAEAKGSLSLEKVELSLKVGAALGLGAKFKAGFTFSPKGLAESVHDFLSPLPKVELFPPSLREQAAHAR
jgi:hypothetical protein